MDGNVLRVHERIIDDRESNAAFRSAA